MGPRVPAFIEFIISKGRGRIQAQIVFEELSLKIQNFNFKITFKIGRVPRISTMKWALDQMTTFQGLEEQSLTLGSKLLFLSLKVLNYHHGEADVTISVESGKSDKSA